MSVIGKILYGLQGAAIGLVVVFLGLAILIGFITLMAQVFKALDAKKAAKARALAEAQAAEQAAAAKAEAAAPVAAPAPAASAAEEVTDDPQLIAVIAAAIAAFSDANKPLVVRKVRRVPGWNRASRAEQVYRF